MQRKARYTVAGCLMPAKAHGRAKGMEMQVITLTESESAALDANVAHCCGCNHVFDLDAGFGLACDQLGEEFCAACIRKAMRKGVWDGGIVPNRGERSKRASAYVLRVKRRFGEL